MRSSTILALAPLLLNPLASAQSTTTVVTLIMPYIHDTAPTASVISANADATTYQITCASGSGSPSSQPASSGSGTGTAPKNPSTMTTAPKASPTANAKRQLKATATRDASGRSQSLCLPPYTLTQGPSTYEIQLTDKDVYTVSMACKFDALTSGSATCTESVDGALKDASAKYPVTSTMDATSLRDAGVAVTVTAALATGTATSPSSSSGVAAAGVVAPTGVAAFVGGAAGVLAAALAL